MSDLTAKELDKAIAGSTIAMEHLQTVLNMHDVLLRSDSKQAITIANIASANIRRVCAIETYEVSLEDINKGELYVATEGLGQLAKDLWEYIKATIKAIFKFIAGLFRSNDSSQRTAEKTTENNEQDLNDIITDVEEGTIIETPLNSSVETEIIEVASNDIKILRGMNNRDIMDFYSVLLYDKKDINILVPELLEQSAETNATLNKLIKHFYEVSNLICTELVEWTNDDFKGSDRFLNTVSNEVHSGWSEELKPYAEVMNTLISRSGVIGLFSGNKYLSAVNGRYYNAKLPTIIENDKDQYVLVITPLMVKDDLMHRKFYYPSLNILKEINTHNRLIIKANKATSDKLEEYTNRLESLLDHNVQVVNQHMLEVNRRRNPGEQSKLNIDLGNINRIHTFLLNQSRTLVTAYSYQITTREAWGNFIAEAIRGINRRTTKSK